MRHIEIMAAGCVPYFVDLEKMPKSTMQFYPKDLLRRAKILEGVTQNGSLLDPKSFSVDTNRINFTEYYDVANQILEHSRQKQLQLFAFYQVQQQLNFHLFDQITLKKNLA